VLKRRERAPVAAGLGEVYVLVGGSGLCPVGRGLRGLRWWRGLIRCGSRCDRGRAFLRRRSGRRVLCERRQVELGAYPLPRLGAERHAHLRALVEAGGEGAQVELADGAEAQPRGELVGAGEVVGDELLDRAAGRV